MAINPTFPGTVLLVSLPTTMHDQKLAKGKAREETRWQLGWWELLPLVDGPRRPVAWSKASVIYTAHPTHPIVLAKHFPSAREFALPSPPTILEGSSTHEPPTLISVSPTEDWLFAYFPGRSCDGVGCLWKRGSQLNTWVVRECFHYSQYAGVVTAEWTSLERPWTISDYGTTPYRLPPRGPTYHANAVPSLLLVTQSHQLHTYFLPPAVTEIRSLKVSLLQHFLADSSLPEESLDPARSHRICTHASIGLSYNEQYIIVATRSKLIPPFNAAPPVNPMDLTLHLGMTSSPVQIDGTESTEWQQWGEESLIDLCMVMYHHVPREDPPSKHIVRTIPLSSIPDIHFQLTDLHFVAVPPTTVPPSPTITRDPRRPTKDSGVAEKGSLYLVVAGLDFGEFVSPPKSHLSLFALSRSAAPDGAWAARLEHARSFDADSGTVAFVQPFPARNKLLVGSFDPVGNMPSASSKRKETRVGSLNVLNLPDLKTDEQWETTPIISVVDGTGRDLPVGVAASPNHAFLCTISPSAVNGTRTAIHSCPRLHPPPSGTPGLRHELSRMLLSAIYSRRSPSDVIHALVKLPPEIALTVLYETLVVLENYANGLDSMWRDEFLGVVTEMYLARSRSEDNELSKASYTDQWKTAHDIVSVRALNSAFEDCREGESYDLDAIWQLVGICRWLIGFLERLMKQCIYIGDPDTSPPMPAIGSPGKHSSESDLWRSPGSTILLFLFHPFALRSLHEAVGHVKRFHDELSALSPTQENSQIAKDVLMDAIDSSGININTLAAALDDNKAIVKLPVDVFHKSLVACRPAPAAWPFLRETAERILKAGAVDRPKLFIKPSELADGVSRMSIVERVKERDPDVVSKGALLHSSTEVACVRCGGRSEIGIDVGPLGHMSLRWKLWEMVWASRCICGGAWLRIPL